MKLKTFNRVKLTDVINPDDIHSISLVVTHKYKLALAIAFKRHYTCSFIGHHFGYCCIYYIPIAHFTYHYPIGVAIPKDDYKYIQFVEFGDQQCTTVNAKLTKQLVYVEQY